MYVCMYIVHHEVHGPLINNVLQIVFVIGQHQQDSVSKEKGKKLKSKVEPPRDPFVPYFKEPRELRERGEVGTLT